MISEIRNNIDTELEMAKELSVYAPRLEFSKGEDREIIKGMVDSLESSIKILNKSIPALLNKVTLARRLTPGKKPIGIERVQYQRSSSIIQVALQEKDREKFLSELSLNESLLRKLKKAQLVEKEKYAEFKPARGYLKLANKFFLNKANQLISKGHFKSLALDIQKANLEILFSTYVSMMLFTAFLAIFAGLFFTIFFLVFSITIEPPFFVLYKGAFLSRLASTFWLIFAVPLATFLVLYVYPSTEKGSLSKKIDQEIPFAVIHMSAISGSGIEPSEIFKIIGLSKEYPYLRSEIRKVLNQINIYGYDLITALTNVARTTPSQKLAELFNGLATTINSGGDLSLFFEKRAESLLLAYRLEREKYTRVAETFMDIYISIVIASPMILMLLLIMISVSGIAVPFTIKELTLIIVSVVAFINILFLGFLQLKQPSY